MGHQLENKVALLQSPQHLGVGHGLGERSHGTDAAKARGVHLPVEQGDGVRDGVGRWQPPYDGVRTSMGVGCPVELDRLLDRVGPRGRGDVHHLPTFQPDDSAL